MKDKFTQDTERQTVIIQQFEELGIYPASYPDYSNPDSFGNNFKQCSILKDVPSITTDSTTSNT